MHVCGNKYYEDRSPVLKFFIVSFAYKNPSPCNLNNFTNSLPSLPLSPPIISVFVLATSFCMEEIMNNQPCVVNAAPSPFSMHRDSQTISKFKPKIRIIHIFAPEIIKTDVANFRELVQRLTGKSAEKVCEKKPRRVCRREDRPARQNGLLEDFKPVARKMEQRRGLEEEEETWNTADFGGFLGGGFTDLDGLMQELCQFPSLPTDTEEMQGLEETRLAI